MLDTPTMYCERLLNSGIFTEPFNIFSNLAFIIAAFFAYRELRGQKDPLTFILPILLGCVGIGSTWWHAAHLPSGDILDTGSILVFASVMAIVLLYKLTGSKRTAAIIFVLLLLITLVSEKLNYLNGSLPYLILLVSFGAFGFFYVRKFPRSRDLVIAAFFVFLIAIVFRSIDLITCSIIPMGTHFLWHLFVAIFGYQLIRLFSK